MEEHILSITGLIVPTIVAFVFCLVLTPVVRSIAVRWKLCDKQNGRGSRDIAHIGGVAMIVAVIFALIPAILFSVPAGPLHRAFLPVLVGSGFLAFLLGIIDDLRSLHYMYKLSCQIAVSVFVAAAGVPLLMHVGLVDLPAAHATAAGIAAAVWILAITTSFNLIDGIDGLASGFALIASLAFAAAGLLFGGNEVAVLGFIVAGTTLAFLRYNFPPAKIFMGDSGSLFLGLLFGLMTLLLLVPGERLFWRAAGCIVILGFPLLDTTLAFARRLLTRRPVFEADLHHVHHVLLYRYRSVRLVDTVLWIFALAGGLLGVLTMRGSLVALVIAAALDLAFFVFALRAMVRIELPVESAREILGRNGISSSRLVPRR